MYYYIVNPSAASEGGDRIRPILSRIPGERGISYQLLSTEYKGHAASYVRDVTLKDHDATIVVIGGDGSIHEVLNGITDLRHVTLGVIPCGSGNDFVKGMGIPDDPAKALEAVLNPRRIVRMDVGYVKQNDTRRRFAVSTGIGFDAAVCHEALSSRIKDKLNSVGLGKLSYTVIAAKNIIAYKPDNVRVQLDGDRIFTFPKTWFIAVMNQPYQGGGLKLCPGATADDGILDVFVCAGITRGELVSALPLTRYGLHTKYRGIHFLKCRSVEILTDRKAPIHLDGESGGTDNILRAGLEPHALRVITE